MSESKDVAVVWTMDELLKELRKEKPSKTIIFDERTGHMFGKKVGESKMEEWLRTQEAVCKREVRELKTEGFDDDSEEVIKQKAMAQAYRNALNQVLKLKEQYYKETRPC